MKCRCLILGSLLLAFVCDAANQDTNATATIPLPSGIVIRSKGHSWTVEQLYRKGLEFIRTKGATLSEGKFEAIVSILMDDKITMCEIKYAEGFGRPVWTVKVGYDGE